MFEAYKSVLREYGVRCFIVEVLNSIAGKFGISRIERLYTLSSWSSNSAPLIAVQTQVLSPEKLREAMYSAEIQCKEEDVQRIIDGVSICIGGFVADRLVALGWYALKPYHHSDSVYAFFNSDWICGYGAWVHSDFRGKGVRSGIVKAALDYAQTNGKRGILSAIAWNNFPSIRSGQAMGYCYSRLNWFNRYRPLVQKKDYWLGLPGPEFERTGSVPSIAFITPFINPALEVAFSTAGLKLVIDCGAPNFSMFQKFKKWILYRLNRDLDLEDWCRYRRVGYMNFSSGDDIFIKDSIRQAGIDYLISYGAPLLHRNVFEAPKKQTWNIHPSLLPSYRGGLPLFWQAWDGVQSTGVTVHLVNEGIDRGAILAQQAFPIL